MRPEKNHNLYFKRTTMKYGKKSAQPHSHKELQIRKHIIIFMIKSINTLNGINDSIVYKFVSLNAQKCVKTQELFKPPN